MNMKLLLSVLMLTITFLSCKKEEVSEPLVDEVSTENATDELAHCTELPEQFIEDFSLFQQEIGITLTAHSECSYEKMNQRFRFKMAPHVEAGGKFFYQYKKRSEYNYSRDPYLTDWAAIPGLYRYDYANKIAYLYSNIDDSDPRVLMDFNKEVGDSVLLGNSFYGDIYFVIDAKEAEFFEEIPFPKMFGRISNPTIGGGQYEEAFVSPYYPNPIVIAHEFDYYLHHDWTESNFYDAFWFQHADGFDYKLKNAETEEVLSAFYGREC